MHTNSSFRRGSTSLAAALFFLSPTLGCQGGTPCTTADTCWNAPEVEALGRCTPKDVWCREGQCGGRCAQVCEVIQTDVNPCSQDGMVCTESRTSAGGLPFCTDHEIACNTIDDCPLYHPPTSDDPNAIWSCEGNVCRYPGFSYAFEQR